MFHRTTEGIRISAQPFFVREQSDPDDERYVFSYSVRRNRPFPSSSIHP